MVNAQKGEYLPELIRESMALNGEEKALLHNLASHQNHVEFGTRARVRGRTGLSERKLRRALYVVSALGLVTIEERPGTTTRYALKLAALRMFSKKSRAETKETTERVRAIRKEAQLNMDDRALPMRRVTPAQGGPTTPAHVGPAKRNSSEEELEEINKNLKIDQVPPTRRTARCIANRDSPSLPSGDCPIRATGMNSTSSDCLGMCLHTT